MAVQIKGILFDIGGVLTLNHMYAKFWADAPTSMPLRIQFGSDEITLEEFIREAAILKGLSREEFFRQYTEIYASEMIIEPVFQLYTQLKEDKYILSDTNPYHQHHLEKNFSKIFTEAKKCFLRQRKEKEGTFENIVNVIGLSPSELLFIDDKIEHIMRARAIGMNAIHYQNYPDLVIELKKFGVLI